MLRRFGVALVLATAAVPLTARAQFGTLPLDSCGTCGLPAPSCGCAAPAPVCAPPPPVCTPCVPPPPIPIFQTQMRPVVQTHLQPQQFTTCEPVVQTHLRREASTVMVPVTTCRQVTVDEGCFQMVWVPRMVTKSIPETTLQPQTCFRDVPVQTVTNVPRVHTRMVPVQSVHMVPETRMVGLAPGCGPMMPRPFAMPGPLPMPAFAPPIGPAPCGSCGLGAAPFAPAIPFAPGAVLPMESTTAATPTPAVAPQEAAAAAGGQWQKVPQRSAESQKIQLQSYLQTAHTAAASATAAPRPLFSPVAPSAATAWQARSAFAR